MQLTNTGVTSTQATMLYQQHRRDTNVSTYTISTGITPTAPVLHQQHRFYTNSTGVTPTAPVDYVHRQVTIQLTIRVAE